MLHLPDKNRARAIHEVHQDPLMHGQILLSRIVEDLRCYGYSVLKLNHRGSMSSETLGLVRSALEEGGFEVAHLSELQEIHVRVPLHFRVPLNGFVTKEV